MHYWLSYGRLVGVLFWLSGLCLSFSSHAQTTAFSADTSTIVVERQVSEAKMAKLRSLEKYHYGKLNVEEMSAWERIKLAFFTWIEKQFFNKVSPNAKPIGYIFLTVIIIFLILQLAGISPIALFQKKNETLAIPYEQLSENIHIIDFPKQIQLAIHEQNFRLGIRLHYLQTLKILSQQELIEWKKDKTNRSYLYELSSESIRSDFEQVTQEFEYVWYGNFTIDLETFLNIEQHFIHFNRSITSTSVAR